MSGQLRSIKNRIRSVENTKKITRAMEMVAAAKLKRFQTMMTRAKPYTQHLESLLSRLIQDQKLKAAGGKPGERPYRHPFFEKRDEKQSAVVIFSSDAGLCGSYNMEIIKKSESFFKIKKTSPITIGVGKTGVNALKKQGREFHKTFLNVKLDDIEKMLKALKVELQELYLQGKVDAVYVIYSEVLSATSFKEKLEKVLPFQEPEQKEKVSAASDYLYEPSPERIFDRLIPAFFEAKIRMVFLESFVAEQIARMNAMHQATKNAKEMIDSLVLLRNKLRQAAITKEIIEIVSGSRAQKK